MFPPDDDEPDWGWRVTLVILKIYAGILLLVDVFLHFHPPK